jgi:protein-S-isoprenylcysteine O-methyltransferase Ste14
LNSEGVIKRTGILRSPVAGYYRVFYNLFAVVSLAAVCSLIPREHEVTLVKWSRPFVAIPVLVWATALSMWYLSFRLLSFRSFLGLDAFRKQPVSGEDHDLVTHGIFGVVRHPQFLGGLMMLWFRDLKDTDLVTNVVLSAYLIVGSKIEEHRLLKKYGDRYRDYMTRVPAFIPRLRRGSTQ